MAVYHIDKSRKLIEGQVLQLQAIEPQYKISELFPDGLGSFGQEIIALKFKPNNVPLENFSLPSDWQQLSILNQELIFELVRQKYFSNLPSRFQCVFASDVYDLDYWINKLSSSKPQLAEISIENAHYCKLDASFLVGGLGVYDNATNIEQGPYFYSVELYLKNAWSYWSGEKSPNPHWEYLITPPVTITRIIR